jgi:hypothetical protein
MPTSRAMAKLGADSIERCERRQKFLDDFPRGVRDYLAFDKPRARRYTAIARNW